MNLVKKYCKGVSKRRFVHQRCTFLRSLITPWGRFTIRVNKDAKLRHPVVGL